MECGPIMFVHLASAWFLTLVDLNVASVRIRTKMAPWGHQLNQAHKGAAVHEALCYILRRRMQPHMLNSMNCSVLYVYQCTFCSNYNTLLSCGWLILCDPCTSLSLIYGCSEPIETVWLCLCGCMCVRRETERAIFRDLFPFPFSSPPILHLFCSPM